MLEKYLKLIQDSRDKKKKIQNFFLSLGMSQEDNNIKEGERDFIFDVENNTLKIKTNSSNRFLLKLNEDKIKDFCRENGFICKVF